MTRRHSTVIIALMKKTATVILLLGLPLAAYRASGCGVVLTAMAVATGAFLVAGIVRIFRIERLYPVVRPALVMGAVAQLCVLVGLFWLTGAAPEARAATAWTAACAFTYMAAVAVETAGDTTAGWLKTPVVAVAAVSASAYQYFIMPQLLVPEYIASTLWHGPALQAELFISALLTGIAMLVLAVYAGDRAGRAIFDIDYIKGVGLVMLALVCVMLALRVSDFLLAGGLRCASCRWGDVALGWYAAEVGLGLVLPAVLLLGRDIRSRRRGIIGVSLFVVAGIIINRMGLATNGWDYELVISGPSTAMEIYAAVWLALAAVTLYWYVEGRLSGGPPPAVEEVSGGQQ